MTLSKTIFEYDIGKGVRQYVIRCVIYYQTLKNGVRMVGLVRRRLNGLVRKAFVSILLHGIETLI